MGFLTSRITLVVVFLLVAGGLICLFGHASWYRWDMKLSAPIAYEIGVENNYYEGAEQLLSDITMLSKPQFEKSLMRQGFAPQTEDPTGLYGGFHRDSSGLKWYLFNVEEGATVFMKKFSMLSGFCSQTVGVLIGEGDDPSVRYFNAGASCV